MTLLRKALLVAVCATALTAGTTATSSAQSETAPGQSARPAPSLSWQLSATPASASTQRLRGLSAVSSMVAWASGTGGTVLRTTDGGATWASVGPPGTEDLQFRDIEATSARHAVILSIGEGTDSRIYVTDDGGAHWAESFRNPDPAAFYDCVAFATPWHGLAMSDPVDGKFRIIETKDAGHSWSLVDPAGMPPAQAGEAGFAASGTCLTATLGRYWLGSGGADPGRVFRSNDAGHTWSVANTPLAGSPSAGVFSVRFRDWFNGIAVGGDYLAPTAGVANAAYSKDGGRTWKPATTPPGGYRSGSAWVAPWATRWVPTAIAVGPTGSDVTRDGGRTWTGFDSGSFDSVECALDGACWASGEQGRVATLTMGR